MIADPAGPHPASKRVDRLRVPWARPALSSPPVNTTAIVAATHSGLITPCGAAVTGRLIMVGASSAGNVLVDRCIAPIQDANKCHRVRQQFRCVSRHRTSVTHHYFGFLVRVGALWDDLGGSILDRLRILHGPLHYKMYAYMLIRAPSGLPGP
jgi:hypothetical protein